MAGPRSLCVGTLTPRMPNATSLQRACYDTFYELGDSEEGGRKDYRVACIVFGVGAALMTLVLLRSARQKT